MQAIKSNTIRKDEAMSLLIVFLSLFCSIDTLLFGINKNGIYTIIGSALFVAIIAVLVFKSRLIIPVQSLRCAMMLGILTVISMGTNREISLKFFYVIMLIVLACLYTSIFRKEVFIEHYCKVMWFFSFCSTIFFVINKVFPRFAPHLPKMVSSLNLTYYHAGVATIMKGAPGMAYREYGIFREPGVYALFIILALMFSMFFLEQFKLKYLFFYLFALGITFSTSGYILMIMLMAVFVLFKKEDTRVIKQIKVLLVFFLMAACVYLLLFDQTNIAGRVFSKLFGKNVSKNSRVDSIAINIKMLFNRPMFALTGNGFAYTENGFLLTAEKIGSIATDNTNTVFRIMVTQGICYVGVLLLNWWRCISTTVGKDKAIFLFAIFLLMLFTENMMLNPMIYILAFYGNDNKRGRELYESV